MLRQFLRIKSLGTLNNFAKLLHTGNRTRSAIRNCSLVTAGFCGVVYAKDLADEYNTANFEEEIKRATKEGEKYLAQLMLMLRTLILQTSVEYQECLIKQIEITKQSMQIGPVGEHWDRLVCFRVKGKELKEELTRYEALATNIVEIVNQQASSMFFDNEIVLEHLNLELMKLQKLCGEQLLEIHKYEAELLAVSRDSILQG